MNKITSETEQQSVSWLMKIQSGKLSDAEMEDFKLWLKKSDENHMVFRKVALLWRKLAYAPTLAEQPKLLDLQQREPAQKRYKHYFRAAIAGIIICICVAFLGVESNVSSPEQHVIAKMELSTGKGEIRQFTLADGSKIWLGAGSKLVVRLAESSRNTELIRGEAMFDVYPNPQSPFYVQVDNTRIKVLGTVFEVQKEGTGITVSVNEGHVRVANQIQFRDLEADESVHLEKGKAIPLPSKFNSHSFAQWRSKRFHFVDTKLKDVIKKLNRYYDYIIYIDDSELAELPITAVFQLGQLEQLLNSLSSIHHFNWHKDEYGSIHIEAQ